MTLHQPALRQLLCPDLVHQLLGPSTRLEPGWHEPSASLVMGGGVGVYPGKALELKLHQAWPMEHIRTYPESPTSCDA